MPRPLVEALRGAPLFFEPVPPPARASTALAESRVAAAARLVEAIDRVDAINVPELVDENHEGRPYYRTQDPRAFARAVADARPLEVVVNKIVAHLDRAALERWVTESVATGVRHLVLVGGSSRYIPYPGPSVIEADQLVRPIVAPHAGTVGNIAIPQRTGEAHRMLTKTRAGASFFTTQLVFDATSVARMIREYDHLCRRANLSPAAVLVSVAPLADEGDIDFARWFGAEIPEEAERAILEGTDSDPVGRSIDRALAVWEETLRLTRADELEVPVGANVEQISARHLDAAGELLRRFAERLPRKGGAGGAG
ncbi:MAG TPA: hypothetical protein VEH57_04800 [Thermoplasmata archaeon]|nr:hypothetical protein [Thermoplasmata archaeon]